MNVKNKMLGNSFRYRVLEDLGAGLSSFVFKAICRDRKNPSVQFVAAIKLFKNSDEQRFLSEVQTLIKISSQRLNKVISWDKIGKYPVLVLECIEGLNLSQLSKLSVLTLEDKVYLIREVYLGLQNLHTYRIVHGDLSPSNIMISFLGEVKLIDFGVQQNNQVFEASKDWASERVLSGHKSEPRDDFDSLIKISNWLGLKVKYLSDLELLFSKLDLKSREPSGIGFSSNSMNCFLNFEPKTTRITKQPSFLDLFYGFTKISLLCVFHFLVNSSDGSLFVPNQTASLLIKTIKGYDVKLSGYDMKWREAPQKYVLIRSGDYILSWKTHKDYGTIKLNLKNNQILSLSDSDFIKE